MTEPTRQTLHLVHRDEKSAIKMVGRDATSFRARAACGQNRTFGSESAKVQCVSNEWASEITCGRCKRIYEHWNRVNAPQPKEWTDPALILAIEWGFRAAEKGWNLDKTMLEYGRLVKS